ncbi:MAG: tRNA uridine-5-carboxymethylaminomethyl(34) synthesis GTPase MnmE [Verrucomicrobiota bacterium]|nr:tRNA uridine-5-carboxymethylaminomethyl(34) synthesis GTPase MnmE [Chthoniobacterales bacterium]MDQ3414453.1 tRNA uridine-5-carboxymethylaminomethyl(34) synthesis GTPase MnmE [Verrucomicrobiota bacterium]
MPEESTATIAAVSTPPGEGAIALVRLAGPDAVAVVDRIFRGQQKPSDAASHFQHFGEIVHRGQVIDQVMLTVHRAPASYTGEDVVEISCHGGVLVTARVWEACLQAGARSARPGEFTERAFLNGKMDLTQAEAVIDLIRAQTDLALRSAAEQLEGRLGEKISQLREALISLIANIEAYIDFPDEDIEPDVGSAFLARLDGIRGQIDALLATADQGRIFREGVRVVIYGATNTGKSSLLNRLLGFPRAIVSETPGTTRDTIEEVVNLRGIALRLTDTAGLRTAGSDAVENEGIARTERSLANADLVLHVVDASAARPAHFGARLEEVPELLLLNKSDLPEHGDWKGCAALRISCTSENGLGGLEDAILAQVNAQRWDVPSAVAINARHRDCLRRALAACDVARSAFTENLAPELVAVDLRGALQAVGEVIGQADMEKILDALFATFCIGK